MDETQKNKEAEEKRAQEEQANTNENSDNGLSEIERAEKIARDMKEANEEKRKLIEREEKIVAKKETLNALGGDSLAGQANKNISEEEKKKQELKEFWKGSSVEKAIEKYG